MTAALGGGELATEWVTLLPETATLAKRLREFRPAPIRVKVEADYDEVERESRRKGRAAGQRIDTEVDHETKGTGRKVAHNVSDELDGHIVSDAAKRAGQTIRTNVEGETRKINLKGFHRSLASSLASAASGTMQIIRNIGTIALVTKYAARALKGFSLSLLAAATFARTITGAGIARLGSVLGFAAGQADRLAKMVARVSSAVLVAAAGWKLTTMFLTASKWAGILTLGMGALTGVILASTSVIVSWGAALVTALISVGSALGIAAGAAAGLLGPAFGVAKIAFSGMEDAAKQFMKTFKDADEAFNTKIGEKMAPLLIAFHDLKLGVTDAFTTAIQPAFTWIGGAIQNLMPRFKGLATTLGNLGGEIAGTLNFKAAQGQFDRLFDASDKFFQSFLGESGIAGVVGGLVDFATTAATTFGGVGKNINDLLLRLGKFLSGVTGDQMKQVFDDIKNVAQNIWQVLGPILGGVKQISDEMRTALAPGVRAFGGGIRDALPGLIDMAKILMPALSNVLEKLAPALPALVGSFMSWAKIFAVLAPVIADVVTKLVPFAPIILAVAGAIKLAVVGIALYNTAMLLFTNITKIARAAQWLFNAALAANPIGLVVAAIAALVAGLTIFFTKTETGRKLWDKLWTGMKEIASNVWNWLKTEGPKLWERIRPSLESLGKALQEAWGKIKDAFVELWPKIQPIVEVLGKAWLAFQGFQWTVIIEAIKALATTIGWWVQNVVVPGFKLAVQVVTNWWHATQTVFNAVKVAVGVVANALQPVFKIIEIGWKNLWFAVQVGWEIGKRVFDAVGTVISAVWNGVVKPIFDALGTAWDFLVEKLTWFGETWTKIWDGLKVGVQAVWDFLKPVRDWLGDFFDSIGDIGSKAATAIKNAWDGLTNILKAPLHALGAFLQGLPSSILGVEIPFIADLQGWGKSLAGLREGGVLRGPGTGISDSIVAVNQGGIPVARVSNGEGVVPTRALATPIGMAMFNELLRIGRGYSSGGAINWGGTGHVDLEWLTKYMMTAYPGLSENNRTGGIFRQEPLINPDDPYNHQWVNAWWRENYPNSLNIHGNPAWNRYGGILGLKTGGVIGQFMNQADKAGYQMGGFSLSAFDCSGLVSAMVNVAMGRAWNQGPPGGSARMATASEAEWLKSQGFQRGAGGTGTLRVGFRNGGAGGGHTAGTLPDGTNFESTTGGVRFGSEATGASSFPEQWFLPRNGPEDPGAGGIPGSMMSGAFSSNGIYGGSVPGGSSGSSNAGISGSYVVDPKKVREAEDKVTDRQNALDQSQQKLDEYLQKQAEGDKIKQSTIDAARDRVDKNSRELDEAKADLETVKQGTFKEDKKSGKSAEGGSDDWSSVGGMIFNGFLEAMGFDGSVFKNLFETPNVKSAMAALNFGLGFLAPKDENGAPQDLGLGGGGDGIGGLLNTGAEMLAGIGEQPNTAIGPHGDMALAGATPGPGNGPTFDLRGSQLGVSPAAFEDKIGEIGAAAKRFPTLGPGK